ncbi:hypothetical protein FRB96_000485 [Tulasnella sp. 330]|nr:hypothetical protein FRB96_000485 [Tulasnella sp. 330]KAG8883046.1 hypothetical protein FRB97_007311 [Tulasnella sp. 331]
MGLALAVGLLCLWLITLVASQTPAVITIMANDTRLVYENSTSGNYAWSKVLQGCGSVFSESNTPGNSVSFNFTGINIQYSFIADDEGSVALVEVDDLPVDEVDTCSVYDDATVNCTIITRSVNVQGGPHTVTIRNLPPNASFSELYFQGLGYTPMPTSTSMSEPAYTSSSTNAQTWGSGGGSSTGGSSPNHDAAIGGAVGGVGLLILAAILWYALRRRRGHVIDLLGSKEVEPKMSGVFDDQSDHAESATPSAMLSPYTMTAESAADSSTPALNGTPQPSPPLKLPTHTGPNRTISRQTLIPPRDSIASKRVPQQSANTLLSLIPPRYSSPLKTRSTAHQRSDESPSDPTTPTAPLLPSSSKPLHLRIPDRSSTGSAPNSSTDGDSSPLDAILIRDLIREGVSHHDIAALIRAMTEGRTGQASHAADDGHPAPTPAPPAYDFVSKDDEQGRS